ncbi:hypothetical protein LSM04_008874 [Trypanosoma melophagium]|uniref:uncharacterized protein n=1 Tax=Trypanosoma melophagium TaxID=715481 RepID=UPI00351A705D|nr:hypothetical protein LSM04_008874 [Trypanosoma melophagium]
MGRFLGPTAPSQSQNCAERAKNTKTTTPRMIPEKSTERTPRGFGVFFPFLVSKWRFFCGGLERFRLYAGLVSAKARPCCKDFIFCRAFWGKQFHSLTGPPWRLCFQPTCAAVIPGAILGKGKPLGATRRRITHIVFGVALLACENGLLSGYLAFVLSIPMALSKFNIPIFISVLVVLGVAPRANAKHPPTEGPHKGHGAGKAAADPQLSPSAFAKKTISRA